MDNLYFKCNNRLDYYTYNSIDEDLNQILEIESISPPNYNNIHVGPRKFFKTSFSQNVINILNRIGLDNINTFEHIKVYDINSNYNIDNLVEEIYPNDDSLILTEYPHKLNINDLDKYQNFGINFDKYEIDLYNELYQRLNRIPTFIELFDLCQSNSEHSRHWFFKGKLFINGEPINDTLFSLVKSTLNKNSNSLVAFSDNSSVIKGTSINRLTKNGNDICFKNTNMDLVLTAETHNFPTLISPFEGANTGVGGRIRDNHATGIGAYINSSLAGYCVGKLSGEYYSGYHLKKFNHKNPVNILIEASNGASD